ncbi:MAG TPA: AAA family ATPase [Solirubrobacteraceae bacterium]|nr:AAA family ATPase [Solirubrobacteraceae bacterium]
MAVPSAGNADWRNSSGERSGLRRYYATLRERWWVVALCTVVTLAAAAIYVAVAPRTYTGEAELLVNAAPPENTILFDLPVLHQSGDPTQDVLTGANLVTTPQVANAVIAALHLRTTTNDLLDKVSATPVGQSNIVAVQAQASSARQAQRIANAFMNEAIAVRSAAMHAAVALAIPSLAAQVAALPRAQRNGPGSLGDELSQLETLRRSPDPTLGVAAAAQLPTAPSTPKTKLSLAAGLLGGLLIGIAAAFAFNALDPRVQREEQLRELFGRVLVLARIPRVGRKQWPGPLVPGQLSVTAIEGYRTLRTTLSTRAGGEPRAYLLTGCGPSEGKTTSAIALSAALAQGGGRVVLIEADLRRPKIASALGLALHFGTEQVLTGEVELADALTTVSIDGAELRVVAAHRSGAKLADRLSVSIAREMIESAKELADFVVIDAPPLTAVIDALPLAQLADEVLVVVRLAQTRLAKLADLDDLLSHQGARPTGFVLVGGTDRDGYGYYSPAGDIRPGTGGAGQLLPDLPEPARTHRRV